jgi:acyl-CoA synthetase (AMP-forming)/AMP-acid ligase II
MGTTPLILTDFLDRAVQLYGNKPAIIDEEGTRYTYGEINDRVNRLAHGLASLGVEKGDRVAYLAPNTLEMYEGFYGVFQTGAAMVSLNTRLKPEDYLYILNHSESKVLFADHELISLIEPVADKLETVETIIVHGAESANGGNLPMTPGSAHSRTALFPELHLTKMISPHCCIRAGRPESQKALCSHTGIITFMPCQRCTISGSMIKTH